jgi:two-component system NtrC family response regulator
MSEAILIVDDDRSVAASLGLLMKQAGYRSRAAASPAEALERLDAERFDLVLQDMNFSRKTTGEEGLELLGQIRARWPRLPVVLITAWGSIELAVRGMRAGASDFVTKPWTNPQMLQAVRTAIGLAAATSPRSQDQALTREALDARYDLGGAIGRDPKFLKVLDVIGRVSATDASILITGESGTGKEVIAEAIHRNSARARGPFVKVNLGGISSSLFESEMFGHVRGAFTDAHQNRRGRFELANGGTIFLDEIGDLDPASQVKMLRVLQDRTYEVLGSSAPKTVDVRVVSATNRNLADLVARGDFREDLLYRLNLIAVQIPPLRERPGDVPALAEHFLRAAARVYGRDALTIAERALRWLQGLPWPGNVRQLKHLVERAVLVGARDTLEVDDFLVSDEPESESPRRDALPPVGSMTLDEIERAMILKSLEHHGGNLSKVAESLGLSRPALYRRLEKYGITF